MERNSLTLHHPPPWAAMLAALAGLVVGPFVLALGAWTEFVDKLETGAFALWVGLIAIQTVVWLVALPVLAGAARRHWRAQPDGRRDAVVAAAVLVLLLAAVPTVTRLAGLVPPEAITHGGYKIIALTVIAAAAAVLASVAIWLIRARLQSLRDAELSKDTLGAYFFLRSELAWLLGYAGAIVGLAVLGSAAMRRAVEARGGEAAAEFAPEGVILYGLTLSFILALVYLPAHLAAQAVGERLRDELAPFPEPARFAAGMAERKGLDDVLGLSVSTTASFRAGVAILAPLLGSLTSLLPTLD